MDGERAERDGMAVVLDTCGREAVVGLARGVEVLAERRFAGRAAAEQVVEELRGAMAEVGCGMGEVARVVVVRGPGSFTGVRVGVATGKGLGEGLGLRLVGVSRLEVLAQGMGACVAVLEAGRGEWFWGRFVDGKEVAEGVGTEEELRAMGVEVVAEVGSGWLGGAERGIGVEAVVRAAQGRVAEDAMRVEGLYLRRTAEELLERQRMHRERKGAGA